MAAALDYMHCGDLVPDSTVREMVRERGCLLVLDGFPGTLGQDETLSQLMEKENLELSAVVNYELPVAEIVSRLSGRRICEKCKAVFHVTRQPSRSEGICDEWGDGCSSSIANSGCSCRSPLLDRPKKSALAP
jgi:adenylate kinase